MKRLKTHLLGGRRSAKSRIATAAPTALIEALNRPHLISRLSNECPRPAKLIGFAPK